MKVTVIRFSENSGATDISRWIKDGWKPHFPAIPVVVNDGYKNTVKYHLTLTKEGSEF